MICADRPLPVERTRLLTDAVQLLLNRRRADIHRAQKEGDKAAIGREVAMLEDLARDLLVADVVLR